VVINDTNSNDCIVLDYLTIQVGNVNKFHFSGKLQVGDEVCDFAGDLRKGVKLTSGGSGFVKPIIHKPIVIIKAESDIANVLVCFYLHFISFRIIYGWMFLHQ
jgi:hypothetical protein